MVKTQVLFLNSLVHCLSSLFEIHVLQELRNVERDVVVVEHTVFAQVLLASDRQTMDKYFAVWDVVGASRAL